jgi:hypothetical protein
MNIKTCAELFDGRLPAIVNPGAGIGKSFVFKLAGEGGGEWTLVVTRSGDLTELRKGAVAHPDCAILAEASDFLEVLSNPSRGMQLFMQGKLRIEGDPMAAMLQACDAVKPIPLVWIRAGTVVALMFLVLTVVVQVAITTGAGRARFSRVWRTAIQSEVREVVRPECLR